MRIEDIIWLEPIVEKLWTKHRVDTNEVTEVFENRPVIRFVEKGNYPDEDVYLALGRTDAGRYVSTFFIYKPDRRAALIISARDMSQAERKRYEQA